jgi:C4-dicarboxylate-specific signal transduction histidine kinase
VIREVIGLARGEIGRNRVELHTQLSDGLPPVLADRVQLQQVMLNLIINGIEAMSDVKDGPRALSISSESNTPDGLLVAVRDSGVGLDSGSLDHLCDAFYTTRPHGMGRRSAGRSSKRTAESCGRRQTRRAARSSSSRYPRVGNWYLAPR